MKFCVHTCFFNSQYITPISSIFSNCSNLTSVSYRTVSYKNGLSVPVPTTRAILFLPWENKNSKNNCQAHLLDKTWKLMIEIRFKRQWNYCLMSYVSNHNYKKKCLSLAFYCTKKQKTLQSQFTSHGQSL